MSKNETGERNKKRALSGFSVALLILMLVFLVVGASTMGVFNSPGKAYHAYKDKTVVFYLDHDKIKSDGVAKIYMNVGSVYTEVGKDAVVTLMYATGSSSSIAIDSGWSSGTRLGQRKIGNIYTSTEGAAAGANYNWICLYDMSSNKLSVSNRLIKLTVAQEMLINEVVFFDSNGKVIPAYVSEKDKNLDEQLKKQYVKKDDYSQYAKVKELFRQNPKGCANLIDSQNNVSKGDSWRKNFTEDEMYTLMQIDNLLLGNSAEAGSVYGGDTDFGSLATLINSLGVLIFGKSTFGLRLMPLICTVLLIGLIYLFTRRIFKSEGFGFLAAVLFSFGGLALTVGRLGLGFSSLALLLLACYYFMYRFYEKGIDQERPVYSALNVLYSGLCFAGAFAIWSNSWIVALGAVALFGLGLWRMHKKERVLERSIALETTDKNAEETDKEVMLANLHEAEGRQAAAAAAHAYRVRVGIVFFLAAFVLGTFLITVLSVLPSYLAYVRMYDNPANPQMSFFALVGAMLENTQNVSNITSLTSANAINAFSWLIGLKGATAYTATAGKSYLALNVQNNLAMTLTSLIGFIVSTVYVIVYLAAGGKENPQYRKNFRKIGRAYLVFTLGSLLSLVACAVIPSASMLYALLFYTFYLGYIPLLVYISYVHDASEKGLLLKKYQANNTIIILMIVLAVYAVFFVASLPMTFGFGMPAKLANILFGWMSIVNNGFFR